MALGKIACGSSRPANRRYLARLAVLMTAYLATLFLAEHLIEDRGVTGVPAYVLALMPGLCVAGIFWVFGALIVEEKDEYLRLLYVRQTLIATGFAMTLAAVWGFLETYKLVAHLEAFWWPVLWCFGLGIGAIINKLTLGDWGAR